MPKDKGKLDSATHRSDYSVKGCKPMPFDDALKRMVNTPPKPKKELDRKK